MPTGVRKPKQKASVEGAVGKIASAVIAALRDRIYLTLDELKKDILTELNAFNAEPFQKRDGSRLAVYESEEKAFLRPLPAVPFEMAEWTYKRLVQSDWHGVWITTKSTIIYFLYSKFKSVILSKALIRFLFDKTNFSHILFLKSFSHNISGSASSHSGQRL